VPLLQAAPLNWCVLEGPVPTVPRLREFSLKTALPVTMPVLLFRDESLNTAFPLILPEEVDEP
jgi:hypothetical protein